MDGVAIGLGLLLAGAVMVFVARPWWAQRGDLEHGLASRDGSVEDVHGEMLADRREAVLTALRDLDFDHAVGKVAKEDYEPLRQALLAEAAGVVAQLDDEWARVEADLDARIEAQVLAMRQTLRAERSRRVSAASPANNPVCPICGQTSRPGDLYCAGCGTRLNAECPQCGRVVRPTDLFCAGCGTKLALAVS